MPAPRCATCAVVGYPVVQPVKPLQYVRPAQARVGFEEDEELGAGVHVVCLVDHGQELPLIQVCRLLRVRLVLCVSMHKLVFLELVVLELDVVADRIERIVYFVSLELSGVVAEDGEGRDAGQEVAEMAAELFDLSFGRLENDHDVFGSVGIAAELLDDLCRNCFGRLRRRNTRTGCIRTLGSGYSLGG